MDSVISKLHPDSRGPGPSDSGKDEFTSPIPDVTTTLFVEAVSSRAAAAVHIAWADLCARSLEPNVFLDPGFAIPLMQHVEPDRRPEILLVWEDNGPTSFERLVGLMPVTLPRFATTGIARAYQDEQIALGGPLLDKDHANEAFAAMIGWLRENSPKTSALLFTAVPSGGGFTAIASAVCETLDVDHRYLDERHRAILRRDPDARCDGPSFPSAKRRKEWHRQSRRLAEVGTLTYRSVTTPSEVARALERFLALEHNGWKGRRGTSLLADGRRATFARTMTRLMAHEGQCRIEAIEIDGLPAAMGILLTTGARAHFWKTAFRESLAAHSPGVQFVRQLTERLRVDPDLVETDSCALPNHPMIDSLWPDRMAVVDLMIGIAPNRSRSFDRAVRLEAIRRRMRTRLKAIFARIRRS